MAGPSDAQRVVRGNALAIATVSQSLLFQSPSSWQVLEDMGLRLTFAASVDQWSRELEAAGRFERIRVGRDVRCATLVRGLLDLRRLMQQDWTLVQVQSPVTGVLARLVPNRSPLIYVAHGFHFHADGSRRSNLAFSLVERLLAGRCGGLGVVCAEDFDVARRLGFDRRTCLWRLPGAGVDIERFSLAPRRDSKSIRLLYIGELNENKDPVRFLDVLRHLRSRGSETTGTIIGDGPLRGPVQRAAAFEPTGLTWVPHTSEPERFLRNCDVLLMPSRREGLPRVMIECLATGRPVVARSNRGSRELITTPAHGRLMAPDASASSWAEAILAVRSAPDSGADLRASVRSYGIDAFRSSYRGLVEHVLSRRDPRGAFDLDAQQRLRVEAGG